LLNDCVAILGRLSDPSLKERAILGSDLREDLGRFVELHIPLNGVVHKEQPRTLLLALTEAVDTPVI
jgi:hypothetical protein